MSEIEELADIIVNGLVLNLSPKEIADRVLAVGFRRDPDIAETRKALGDAEEDLLAERAKVQRLKTALHDAHTAFGAMMLLPQIAEGSPAWNLASKYFDLTRATIAEPQPDTEGERGSNG